jgi:rSAM/selenodomain-associated transferase 1
MNRPPRITLYTKPGCHLCEAVEQVIARVRRKTPLELEVRNILDDAGDFTEYQYEVPVVFVNGREVSRYRLTASQLEAALSPLAIVVMAKAPIAGGVKTRLQPELTPKQAADVHRVFLRHVVNRLRGIGEVIVCFDPPDAGSAMRTVVDAKFVPQCSGDLGARLASASRAISEDRILFLGVDSPDVPTSAIHLAVRRLDENDIVLGPCDDGGFWCLALRKTVDAGALLSSIEWSTGRELEQTLARARGMDYRAALADRWDDVDRPDDLRRLVSRLAKSDNEADMQLLRELNSVLPATCRAPEERHDA